MIAFTLWSPLRRRPRVADRFCSTVQGLLCVIFMTRKHGQRQSSTITQCLKSTCPVEYQELRIIFIQNTSKRESCPGIVFNLEHYTRQNCRLRVEYNYRIVSKPTYVPIFYKQRFRKSMNKLYWRGKSNSVLFLSLSFCLHVSSCSIYCKNVQLYDSRIQLLILRIVDSMP